MLNDLFIWTIFKHISIEVCSLKQLCLNLLDLIANLLNYESFYSWVESICLKKFRFITFDICDKFIYLLLLRFLWVPQVLSGINLVVFIFVFVLFSPTWSMRSILWAKTVLWCKVEMCIIFVSRWILIWAKVVDKLVDDWRKVLWIW